MIHRIIFISAMLAVAACADNGAAERAAQARAAQAQAEQAHAAATARMQAQTQQCMQANFAKQADRASCFARATKVYAAEVNLPHSDLLNLYLAKSAAAAQQVDDGTLTYEQYQALDAQYWAESQTMLQQREAQATMANAARANAQAAQNQAEAAQRQAAAAEAQARQSALPSGPLWEYKPIEPIPTRESVTCTQFGNSITCR